LFDKIMVGSGITKAIIGSTPALALLLTSSASPSLTNPMTSHGDIIVGAGTEQATWQRSASNPVLTGAAWEGAAVEEPTVIYDAGVFKMWYRGGWSSAGIGYATSPDGITWTKSGSNPVITGTPQQPDVVKSGSTFHSFYAESLDIHHRTSSDGIGWSSATTAIAHSGGISQWANSSIYMVDALNWYMLLEGNNGTSGRFTSSRAPTAGQPGRPRTAATR
jgi:hypothetical protein